MHESVSVEQFRTGMRHLTAAVTLVSSEFEGEKAGLTATAVCSVTAEPPSILACVNRTTSASDIIKNSGFFCVNVLSLSQQPLSDIFGWGDIKQSERFKSGCWGTLKTGAPVLEGCVVNFDCETDQLISHGTHDIIVGRIIALQVNDQEAPLLYGDAIYSTIQQS